MDSSPSAKSSIVVHPDPKETDSVNNSESGKDSELTQLTEKISTLRIDTNLSVIERNVLKALLIQLPHYVKPVLTKLIMEESGTEVSDSMQQQLQTLQKDIAANTASLMAYGETIKKLQGHVKQLDSQVKGNTGKLSGYKQQAKDYTEKVKGVQGQINTLNLNFAKYNKENNNRSNEYNKLQHKVKTELDEVKKMKNEYNKHLKEVQKVDLKKFKEIEESQEFISAKYEEVNKNVKKVEEDLATTKSKSEQNAAYSRLNNLEVAGVPVLPNEQDVDCKTIIKEVCRELHYNIREGTISTAHRLKPRRDGGPPAIIVRFNNRDVRNDVYKLKSQLKDKTEWQCYNIHKLYINESLTPEKRSLLYKTKKKLKELLPAKQRCFVWTYKGNVFCRKDEEGAPRILVVSEDTLDDISSGKISLSPTADSLARAPLTFPNNIATN